MAAATIAVANALNVIGNKRRVSAKLTAPADTNTWDSGLSSIDEAGVQTLGAAVAADVVTVDTISGGVITLQVVGTSRDCFIYAVGN